jgi:hypothetical protein
MERWEFMSPERIEAPEGIPVFERQRRIAFAAVTDFEALKRELG